MIDQRVVVVRAASASAGAPATGRPPPPPGQGRLRVRQGSAVPEACEPKAAAPLPPLPAGVKPDGGKITLAADACSTSTRPFCALEGKAKLDELAAKAGELKLEVILAVGHTDRIGRDAYNQKLSESAPPPSRSTWLSKASKPTAFTPKARARSSPSLATSARRWAPESGKNKKLVECLQPDRRVDIEIIGTSNSAAGAAKKPCSGRAFSSGKQITRSLHGQRRPAELAKFGVSPIAGGIPIANSSPCTTSTPCASTGSTASFAGRASTSVRRRPVFSEGACGATVTNIDLSEETPRRRPPASF